MNLQVKHVLSGLAFIVLASVCGVLIAIWTFKHFNIYIPLENQKVSIDLQEPLQAEVKIHDALDVDVTGRVNAEIPIRENLNIPLTQTLTPRVYFDNQVPIKTTIPVRETLKINQNMPVDTLGTGESHGTRCEFAFKRQYSHSVGCADSYRCTT